MKDPDERDTQKMTPPPAEDLAEPAVRKFHYRTDPGAVTDTDKDLLRGLSRARDERDDRAETLGKLLDDTKSEPTPTPPFITPISRPVTVVRVSRLPGRVIVAALMLSAAILAVTVLIAMKGKSTIATPAASVLPARATSAPVASATNASPAPPPGITASIHAIASSAAAAASTIQPITRPPSASSARLTAPTATTATTATTAQVVPTAAPAPPPAATSKFQSLIEDQRQ